MGTKVHANAFLPECHSVINLTGSTSDGTRPVQRHEGQLRKNGYSGHDIEKVRQTIIEHESIFRNQLQELHRLYGRQRELMSEIRKYVPKDKCLPVVPPPQDTRSLRTFEPRFFTSGILPKETDKDGILSDNKLASCDRDTKLSLSSVRGFDFYSKSTNCPGDFSVTNPKNRISDDITLSRGANPCSGFNLAMKDFFQNSLDGKSCPSILGLRNERSGKKRLFEDYTEEGRFGKHYSVKDLFCSGKPLLTEPISEPSHCPYTGPSVSRKKKNIFGVEISGDEYPLSTTSSFSTPRQTNHHTVSFNKPSSWVSDSCMKNLDLARKNANNAKNELNFGNVPYQVTGSDPRKCFNNSDDVNSKPIEFQSNHKHPQNGLPWFLKNSQVSSESSKTKKRSYFMNLDSLQNYSEKFFRKAETAEGKFHTLEQKKEIIIGDDSGRKVEMDEKAQKNQVETKCDLGLHKWINNSCIPNLSRLYIDLNVSLDDEDALAAPSLPTAVVKIATAEIDFEAPSPIDPEVSYKECEKIAANAILDISSFSTKRSVKNEESCDLLKWFADIISSAQNGPQDEVGNVPDGMDDFELMTLRLEDVKEEQHYHEHVVLKSLTSDTLVSKRSRRGRQQRRDFQRDILPGLVTLTRLEVTEDFQAFQELVKAKRKPWGSARNVRGRKRSGSQDLSPASKLVCSGRVEMSLRGWGRRTKRLPRQRCGSVFIPVKC